VISNFDNITMVNVESTLESYDHFVFSPFDSQVIIA